LRRCWCAHAGAGKLIAVRAYVGVTDGEWYRFLAARPALDEVNFWRPGGGRGFHALTPGEPFFFKTHHPHNKVVGGGFYSGFAPLRISEAWELLGEDNGVHSLTQMRARVAQYRRAPIGPAEDPVIGCVFVRNTVFFPSDALAAPPPDFAPNIVQGKSYDLAAPESAGFFQNLIGRLLGAPLEIDLSQPWHRPGPIYGDPRLARNAWASNPSRPSSSTPTTAAARSPGRRSDRYCKPRTSAPYRPAANIASTTACYCAPTCTPSSTAGTSRSIRNTGCWSVPGYATSSATENSSTPAPDNSSRYPTVPPTGHTGSSSNGTSTRCTRPPDQSELTMWGATHQTRCD
jgi:hypothetical protein